MPSPQIFMETEQVNFKKESLLVLKSYIQKEKRLCRGTFGSINNTKCALGCLMFGDPTIKDPYLLLINLGFAFADKLLTPEGRAVLFANDKVTYPNYETDKVTYPNYETEFDRKIRMLSWIDDQIKLIDFGQDQTI